MEDERGTGTGEDWDVALAGMLAEAHRHKGGPLGVDDLVELARGHATRLDDLLDTLRALCEAGRWCYQDGGGAAVPMTLPPGRLSVADVAHLDGGWRPAG